MKRLIFISISLFLALSVYSQERKQEVIASAGGYNVNGGISISWTLGETIIPAFKSSDNSLVLTHGFQQQLIITAVEENLEPSVKVTVFPNPVSEVVNIHFETPVDGEIKIFLFDSQGKMVKTDLIKSDSSDKQINLKDLPGGIYYLRLIKGLIVNVYKVVKL